MQVRSSHRTVSPLHTARAMRRVLLSAAPSFAPLHAGRAMPTEWRRRHAAVAPTQQPERVGGVDAERGSIARLHAALTSPSMPA